MSYILATYKKDWADEMDVYDLVIMPMKTWEKFLMMAAHPVYPFTAYIGTNEEIEFHHTNDVMPRRIVELTDEEGRLLVSKLDSWGDTYTLGNLFDCIWEGVLEGYEELMGETDESTDEE